MAPRSPLLGARGHDPVQGTSEPLYGLVISVVLSMLSISALSAFTTQRYLAVKTWKQLPLVQWLVFAIYADSFLFVLATAIVQFGFGVGYSGAVCDSAILLCLVCYVTTKLIYMFMVEKAYIIRSSNKKPRLRSKLYIFNSFGMIGAYCVMVVPNFVLRFARLENGDCIIGMQRPAMIPLIVFDLLVNVYLTIIFLKPLSGLYSYKNFDRAPGSRRLKTIATRTFIGCICTLISSIVNLSVLVGLNGEPGWVCLMCCNSDILFSAIVIHWVTSRDSTSTANITDDTAPSSSSPNQHHHHHHHNNNHNNTGDELSAIPPRAAHHRLPDNDNDTDIDLDLKPTKHRHGHKHRSARRSHLSLSTEAEEAMVGDGTSKTSLSMSIPPSDDYDTRYGDREGGTSPCSSTSASTSTGATNTLTTFHQPHSDRQEERGEGEQKQEAGQSIKEKEKKKLKTKSLSILTTEEVHVHINNIQDDAFLSPPPSRSGAPSPSPSGILGFVNTNTIAGGDNGGGGGGGGGAAARNRAASEVRVDVDYGATTTTTTSAVGALGGSREGAGGGLEGPLRLGNVVVIGSGGGNGNGDAGGGAREGRLRGLSNLSSGWR